MLHPVSPLLIITGENIFYFFLFTLGEIPLKELGEKPCVFICAVANLIIGANSLEVIRTTYVYSCTVDRKVQSEFQPYEVREIIAIEILCLYSYVYALNRLLNRTVIISFFISSFKPVAFMARFILL